MGNDQSTSDERQKVPIVISSHLSFKLHVEPVCYFASPSNLGLPNVYVTTHILPSIFSIVPKPLTIRCRWVPMFSFRS